MTAPVRPYPPRPHAGGPPPAPSPRRTEYTAPAVAGLAVVCSATALTGVIEGMLWLGYIIVATMLIAFTGIVLRAMRAPAPAVAAAQLFVLLLLVVGVYTRSGILGFLPGPAAFAELSDVLLAAAGEVRNGLPPVEATGPILCLVTIAIGLVAVLVDQLVVAAHAPASTGLVLLCVYAVPSALATDLLPWWTFVLGAASFAALLAVDGSHRHRRWTSGHRPATAPATGSGTNASTPVTLVSAALVVGLLAGSTVTAIGTEGSLPGSGSGGSSGPGGLGVNPFTSLRGMLDQGEEVELFRVRGLRDDRRLLRAFTLDTYRPNQGWTLPDGRMPVGVPADGPLPAAPGDDGTSESRRIRVEPVNWYDLWLPTYGAPRELRGLSQGWYYDRMIGAVYRERRTRPGPYVMRTSLAEPSKDTLRTVSADGDAVPPAYTQAGGIDPRVTDLSRRLTRNATNDFDRVQAIWGYFSAANGFVYDEQTAPANDPDAVADFLLNGKRGFCEQYASSMAVMLRSIGLPSRVAVGFTTGVQNGDYRSITSQDAHAWVEVYFADLGWISFDPTPLADGRGYIPPYLRVEGQNGNPGAEDQEVPTPQASPEAQQTQPQDEPSAAGAPRRAATDAPSWAWLGVLIAAGLALALTAAALVLGRRAWDGKRMPRWLSPAAGGLWLAALLLLAWTVHWTAAVVVLVVTAGVLLPAGARAFIRQQRLRAVAAGAPQAANAAWQELLDECADRGAPVPASDTVRRTAQRVAEEHRLDDAGRTNLATVVDTVERSWYSGARNAGDNDLATAFDGVRASLRRSAPMPWRARLLPRSVLRRR